MKIKLTPSGTAKQRQLPIIHISFSPFVDNSSCSLSPSVQLSTNLPPCPTLSPPYPTPIQKKNIDIGVCFVCPCVNVCINLLVCIGYMLCVHKECLFKFG